MSGRVDLSVLKKDAPLKTSEEIRADWLQERVGKFTASEFYRLTTYQNKKELSKGAITYCTEKVVECLSEFDSDNYTSHQMQWGIDNEIKACNEFTLRTGIKITRTGGDQKFLTLGSHIGGTPDGLIENYSGIEIKCPNSLTHFKYMGIKTTDDLKKVMSNYYWQIQGLMMITGCKHWYFISYDPRYKLTAHQLHQVKIQRNDEDIDFLMARIKLAIKLKEELLSKFHKSHDPFVSQKEVLHLLNIGRTKLWEIRKSDKFPKPVTDIPLCWRSEDIENYVLNLKG